MGWIIPVLGADPLPVQLGRLGSHAAAQRTPATRRPCHSATQARETARRASCTERSSPPMAASLSRVYLATVTLWRPTGPEELALVEASGWREWPPRLPEQPILYPVINEEYATRIARDWNVPPLRRQLRSGSVRHSSTTKGSTGPAARPSWSTGSRPNTSPSSTPTSSGPSRSSRDTTPPQAADALPVCGDSSAVNSVCRVLRAPPRRHAL